MNIKATLKALPIQAPSSKEKPRCPRRSATPSVSKRPARVTIPAPMTTPRIPNSGLWERSTGSAAANAAMPEFGVLGIAVSAALILPSRAHGGDHGEPGAELRDCRRVIEQDLYRDPLHHFGEVAGSIVWR